MDDKSGTQRKEEAQIYLAKHHVKEIYAKLVYEITLLRVNEPVKYMLERLQEFEKHGLQHQRHYPRIIFVIGETTELQAYCYRQLCDKFRFRYVNISEDITDKQAPIGKAIQDFIQNAMKETDNIDFILDNYPTTIQQALEFEKSFIECRLALHIDDDRVSTDEEAQKNTKVLKQYFSALGKLKTFKLSPSDVEATVTEMSKLFE